jgi:hypothetical protein
MLLIVVVAVKKEKKFRLHAASLPVWEVEDWPSAFCMASTGTLSIPYLYVYIKNIFYIHRVYRVYIRVVKT